MMKKIKVISCVITVAIMTLIFFFSSQTAAESSETSRGLTEDIANLIATYVHIWSADQITDIIHTFVRKVAHFVLYFSLGLSASVSIYLIFGYKRLKLMLITLAFCFLYAITDEIHQMFVPGRAAMIRDVIIDSCGALCSIAIFVTANNVYLRRKKRGL